MENFDFNIINQVVEASWTLSFLKYFLIVYSVVLIIDFVLVLYLRGFTGSLRQTLYQSAQTPMYPGLRNYTKRWRKIESHLETNDIRYHALALQEADTMAAEVIKASGFQGSTYPDRLEHITTGQLECIENLRAAHTLVADLQAGRRTALTLDETRATLDVYRELLEELRIEV